jgi:hypothetical protein
MKRSTEKALDDLIAYTIQPALYDDLEYKSEEEFQAIKQQLIESIQEIEYIEQYDDDGFDEEEE